MVEITQADREAALALRLHTSSLSASDYRAVEHTRAFLAGECDDWGSVQAFSRHRIAAEQRAQAGGEPTDRNVYRLQLALKDVCEALRSCRDQFDFYAKEHEKAGKSEKAATNRAYADLATQALKKKIAANPPQADADRLREALRGYDRASIDHALQEIDALRDELPYTIPKYVEPVLKNTAWLLTRIDAILGEG